MRVEIKRGEKMEKPYIDHGLVEAGDNCFNCEQTIGTQLYLHWPEKDIYLCSSCLMDLFECVFGAVRSNKKEVEQYKKTKIANDLRWEIWKRDDFTCQYCRTRSNLAIDHIIPESRGGKTIRTNLVTCCNSCNSKKGSRTPEEANMPLIKDRR